MRLKCLLFSNTCSRFENLGGFIGMILLVRKLKVLSYQCFCVDISLCFHQGNVVSFLFIFCAGNKMKYCRWLVV